MRTYLNPIYKYTYIYIYIYIHIYAHTHSLTQSNTHTQVIGLKYTDTMDQFVDYGCWSSALRTTVYAGPDTAISITKGEALCVKSNDGVCTTKVCVLYVFMCVRVCVCASA
jgi:hypothetical protein